MFKAYLKKISEISSRGDATEESYYSALADLLETYAESIGKKKIQITTLPKRTEAGNPDFKVWHGTQHLLSPSLSNSTVYRGRIREVGLFYKVPL